MGSLHFEKPDTDTFRCLPLAYRAIEKGGNMPCIMNAANEVAVQAFLEERLPFTSIAELIEKAMDHVAFIASPNLEQLEETDRESRRFASQFIM